MLCLQWWFMWCSSRGRGNEKTEDPVLRTQCPHCTQLRDQGSYFRLPLIWSHGLNAYHGWVAHHLLQNSVCALWLHLLWTKPWNICFKNVFLSWIIMLLVVHLIQLLQHNFLLQKKDWWEDFVNFMGGCFKECQLFGDGYRHQWVLSILQVLGSQPLLFMSATVNFGLWWCDRLWPTAVPDLGHCLVPCVCYDYLWWVEWIVSCSQVYLESLQNAWAKLKCQP